MGKQKEKKKKRSAGKCHGSSNNKKKTCENSTKAYDKDTIALLSLSHEFKEEGNRLFLNRDYEEAMLYFDKAIKFLPRNHVDVSYLHSNIAACYMELGLSEYRNAIHECNLALEVTPEYTKALLKRARCYEALNRLDLALRDARRVLCIEPNNFMAAEIADRVKATIEETGGATDISVDLIHVPAYIEPPMFLNSSKASKVKARKKKDEPKRNNKNHAKGNKVVHNQSDVGLGNKWRGKRRRKKKNKTKKVSDVANLEKSGGVIGEEDNEIDIVVKKITRKRERKRKNSIVPNGVYVEGMSACDNSDEEENDEKLNVEYNRFDILNYCMLDGNKNDEEDGISKVEKKTKCTKVSVGVQWQDEFDEEKKAEDKLVVKERATNNIKEDTRRTMKFIYGDDIRFAQIPINCSILKLRDIVCNRFPCCIYILIKYKDQEGDLVTITTTEELRWAESSVEHGSIRIYIVDVNPEQDPLLEKIKQEKEEYERSLKQNNLIENEYERKNEMQIGPSCIEDWIIHFACLFKDFVGFEPECYLDLHDVGVKAYSEAMEDTVTCEEAQDIFNMAEEKFQEMAAVALFNWGNAHMSRARRRVRDGYNWAQKEYSTAGSRFEEALKIKPNFYEGIIALGQLQFEQAKLSWYYTNSNNTNLEIVQLYNNAGKNMERGIHMWEEALVQHLIEVTNQSETDNLLQQMKLGNLFKQISIEETAEDAANIRSQVNLLWGTILYERSVMEFKLGLSTWQDFLEAAADKFELAGASPEDVVVMLKNHCSNSLEGLNGDEAEQAWNEMYEAIRWQMDIPALHLEPLLRKRVCKIDYVVDRD